MDANYAVDEELGNVEFDLNEVPLDAVIKKTFYFNEVGNKLTLLVFSQM